MSYLVLCGTRATALFDREKVRQSAPELTQLGGHVQVLDVDKGGYDLLLWVHPPDGHDFQVMRDVEGGSLSTDATAQQVAAVGAWTAQVADFPDDSEVWLIDGHAARGPARGDHRAVRGQLLASPSLSAVRRGLTPSVVPGSSACRSTTPWSCSASATSGRRQPLRHRRP